jgi:hypothetical protein
MKLLADHNFYHISNKRSNEVSSSSSLTQSNQKNINLAYREIYENAHRGNPKIAFKYNNGSNHQLPHHHFVQHQNTISTGSRPYELTEFFNKYNSTKHKRGMNSSSNSLVSLNESSTSPNEELNFTNSDRDLIRSNPDLNDGCVVPIIKKVYYNSPKNPASPVNSNGSSCHKPKRLESQTSDFHLNSLTKKDQNSCSNNGSLNLSIHTAEEFSIEMLSWLKNESHLNSNVKKIINEENIDQIDNATLV